MFPRSFSNRERAFAKYVAALDKVSPLVQVFATPYFWLSSDNLFPAYIGCIANQFKSIYADDNRTDWNSSAQYTAQSTDI
jgi:hypothetical protein